jgi:hypothetical protein
LPPARTQADPADAGISTTEARLRRNPTFASFVANAPLQNNAF